MQARFKLIYSLMNLLRLLLIALAVWIIVVLIRNRRSRQAALKNRQDHQAVDRILPCAVCGIHVPEGEAIHEAGKVYCSPEHRDQSKNAGN
jgi:uncharacterized protein